MRPDKLIFIIAVISSVLVAYSLLSHPEFNTFHIQNKDIFKKHKSQNTINIISVTLLATIIPLLIIIYVFRFIDIQWYNAIQFITLFLTCHLVVLAIVENLKNIVGRPRPDFYERCAPIDGKCTQGGRIVIDGLRSFPSGHSATSACGFAFLFLFLDSKLTKRNECTGKLIYPIRLFIKINCFVFALVIGATRYFDNRHFISDIVAGLIIGTAVSYLMFKRIGESLLKNNSL